MISLLLNLISNNLKYNIPIPKEKIQSQIINQKLPNMTPSLYHNLF